MCIRDSPLLSRRIQQDTERLALARETYDQYLKPIAAMIDGRQEQQAVDRYRKMVGELSRRYGVSIAG